MDSNLPDDEIKFRRSQDPPGSANLPFPWGPAAKPDKAWQVIFSACAAAAILASLVLGRYTVVASSHTDRPAAYRLDRWTGEIHLVVNDEAVKVTAPEK